MYKVWKNCIGCGECAKACDFNLIQTFDDYILMDIEKCRHCSKCVETYQNNVFTKSVIFKHFLYLLYYKIKKS
jgi:ferredoxin